MSIVAAKNGHTHRQIRHSGQQKCIEKREIVCTAQRKSGLASEIYFMCGKLAPDIYFGCSTQITLSSTFFLYGQSYLTYLIGRFAFLWKHQNQTKNSCTREIEKKSGPDLT